MKEKILSIYIPTYNRSKRVVKQLNFIIDEMKDVDIDDIEVIVNDNCSTDDTEEKVLDTIAGQPIIYHKNETNLGIVGNAYEAIKYVHGQYFWLISDDDKLQKGIIKRVLEIISMYPKISYVFLNYSDNININKGIYDGPAGLFSNGASMLLTDECAHNVPTVVFTTSSIYLKESLVETINNLPLKVQESYGWSGYAALDALKKGNSYFDDKVWVSYGIEKSWEDIEDKACMGAVRSLCKLNVVGYTRKEIRQILKHWIGAVRILYILVYNLLWKKKSYKQFIIDDFFCLKRAPVSIIGESGKLVIKLAQKVKSGKITWDK